MDPLVSLAAALALASVHLFSPGLRLLAEIPRSRLLSVAGGIAVAFVVLQILPALQRGQETFERTRAAGTLPFLRDHIYIGVLIGVVVFYGLERLVRESKRRAAERDDPRPARLAFWIAIVTFAVVDGLIGYVLVARAARGAQALLLFTVAMVLKFIVDDHGLHADHEDAYDRIGRWVLTGAVLAGWLAAYAGDVPAYAPALLQALIAGAVLLNTLKEELPAYRESRFWAFALGAAAYAALLLAMP